MEKFEFASEEEMKIYRQLLGPKEAVLEAYVEKNAKLVELQFEKADSMLAELENHYSLAIYDLEEPSRMKRIWGRVVGKLLKVFFMGPFAKKQIAYNKQVLVMLTQLRQLQEGFLEVLQEMQEEEE